MGRVGRERFVEERKEETEREEKARRGNENENQRKNVR